MKKLRDFGEIFEEYATGKTIFVRRKRMAEMSAFEFASFLCMISNNQMCELILQTKRNETLNRTFMLKINELERWGTDIGDCALKRFLEFEKLYGEAREPAPDTQAPEQKTEQERVMDLEKPAPKSRAYTMASSLFLYYPDFESDYETLLQGYMRETDNGLQWLKSKQSLAEYFGNLPKKGKNHKWADIEKLFNEKNLRQSFSRNGNSYKGQSADYAAWLNIKNIAPTAL
jgi:hypothetical protein